MHLAYADDVIIFSSGGKSSLNLLKQVLEWYTYASEQRINSHKSCFLTHPRFPSQKAVIIGQTLGFQRRAFLVRYLGCPLYVGRRKMVFFADTVTAMATRILSCQNRLLSAAGRLVLVKSVLASLSVHLLAAASPPKEVFGALEKLFACFFWWPSNSGAHRH